MSLRSALSLNTPELPLIAATHEDMQRLEDEARAAGRDAAAAIGELREVERLAAEATDGARRKLEKKAAKLRDPATAARTHAAKLQRQATAARANLVRLRAEASELQRLISRNEVATARWALDVGDQVAEREREEFNFRDRHELEIRKLRRSLDELLVRISEAAKAEIAAREQAGQAKAEAERLRTGRELGEVYADGPDAIETAKKVGSAASDAIADAVRIWCKAQLDRYRTRHHLERFERRYRVEHDEKLRRAEELRETLARGLTEREDELRQHRKRLKELTGSAEAAVSR